MRIVFLASGEFAVPTLRWLHQSDHEIAAVVTQPDRASGRGRRATATPVKQMALELGLPVMAVEKVNAPAVLEELANRRARLGLVIAFGQKLGPRLTDRGHPARSSPDDGHLASGEPPRRAAADLRHGGSSMWRPARTDAEVATLPVFASGSINLHASLLPRHRGAAPIQRAVLAGDVKTGVTVFRLTQTMDGGSLLVTRHTLIKPAETADELHDRLAAIGVDAVRAALALYDGGAEPDGTPQPTEGVSGAGKLRKEDGYIDFAQPAEVVCRQVCGLWSWPGAVCEFTSADGTRRERTTLARARPAEAVPDSGPPGTIDTRLYVAASPGAVEVLEIKPASGKLLTWRDFVNGRRVKPGDRFVPVTAAATPDQHA